MRCYQCVHLIVATSEEENRMFFCAGKHGCRQQDPQANARSCGEFALDNKVEWLEEDAQRRIDEAALLSAEAWKDVLWEGVDKVGLEKKCEALEKELADARAELELMGADWVRIERFEGLMSVLETERAQHEEALKELADARATLEEDAAVPD